MIRAAAEFARPGLSGRTDRLRTRGRTIDMLISVGSHVISIRKLLADAGGMVNTSISMDLDSVATAVGCSNVL